MTKNEDISNPFEVTERKRLAVQNNVDKNKYLTIIFFSQHYTQLDTCSKCHPTVDFNQLNEKFYKKNILQVRPASKSTNTCSINTR